MILVTGAGGKTGRAVIAALREHGAPLRAFVRSESQAQRVLSLGVSQAIVGDMRSRADFDAALDGVGTVYHIGPNMHPEEGDMGATAVAACRAAGVKHFVYHSVLYPQIEAMPHHWRKLRIEEILIASGLTFTVLQPAAYMQNLLSQAEGLRNGMLRLPYPADTQLALVDLLDVAQAAAVVILEPDHGHAHYQLVGEGNPDQVQVAQALSAVLGRPLDLEIISQDSWRELALESGLKLERVADFAAMFEYYSRAGMPGNPRQLSALLGRRPTLFVEFAEREFGERPA